MQFTKAVEVFCRFSHSCMRYLFYLLILAFTVTGCSSRSGDSTADRVAAVVNGVEITQFEVRTLYERTAASGVSKEVEREQKRNILANLVRSELLAQEAVKLSFPFCCMRHVGRFLPEWLNNLLPQLPSLWR